MIFARRVAFGSSFLHSSLAHHVWKQPGWLSSLTSKDAVLGYHSSAKKRGKRFVKKSLSSHTIVAVPSLDIAKTLPTSFREMENSSLLVLSAMGNYDARVEVLKRHIMTVDRASYDVATSRFLEISKENRKRMWLSTLPHRVGMITALVGGAVSFPLCFHRPTVEWFNDHFVTTSVPEPEDLETFLEVGAWAWNWMEPPLGQISFFLLCLQFSRSQLMNLGIRPYTQRIKQLRGENLAKKFPMYNAKIIKDFSVADEFYHDGYE